LCASDFAAAHEYGAKTEGSSAALNASVLAELAALIAYVDLQVPIAATFPLDQVQAAFSLLERGHIPGKIVLLPSTRVDTQTAQPGNETLLTNSPPAKLTTG
jgi:hypothetical protein